MEARAKRLLAWAKVAGLVAGALATVAASASGLLQSLRADERAAAAEQSARAAGKVAEAVATDPETDHLWDAMTQIIDGLQAQNLALQRRVDRLEGRIDDLMRPAIGGSGAGVMGAEPGPPPPTVVEDDTGPEMKAPRVPLPKRPTALKKIREGRQRKADLVQQMKAGWQNVEAK